MATAEPTDAELQDFATLAEVAAWAALPGTADDDKSALGALLLLLGAAITMPPRVVASLPEADFDALLQSWSIDGQPPTPVQRTTAAMFGLACRIACKTQKRQSQIEKEAADKAANALAFAQAQASAQSQAQAQALALQPKNQRMVKLSTVVSQVAEQECSILEPAKLKQAYKKYYNVFKKEPPPEAELTEEQLTGLDALLSDASKPVPYLDFSIWGPHHHRREKWIKLSGTTFDSNGKLRQIEILGPPNDTIWKESYDCLEVGFVMFDVVDLGNIIEYCKVILKYVKRYGPALWYLIYQTDHRMRRERMDRIRRRGEHEHAQAALANGSHPFDPNRPWNWVWQEASRDTQFWREELEEPALLVLTRTQSLDCMIDGDAKIGAEKDAYSGQPQINAGTPDRPPLKRKVSEAPTPRKAPKPEKVHRVSNGKYTHNRAGMVLCNDFQTGQCNVRGKGTRCGKDANKAHHCELCLSPEHGAASCSKQAPPSSMPRFEKGKGKGGKGAGKGKRHF